MKSKFARRSRRSSASSIENSFFKRESKQEHVFFSNTPFFHPAASIHRKCEKCEEDDQKSHRMTNEKEEKRKLQRQPDKKEEEKKLQRKETDSSANTPTSNYYSNISGGQNLSKDVNDFYSSRMGHDFSDVKIHTGSEAATSAREINARAYTIGNHIVFNDGEYNPSSHAGKKLLAHELTHVVQKKSNNLNQIQRAVKFKVAQWDMEAGKPPALENKSEFIVVPKNKQVVTDALVEVNGSPGDNCTDFEFGITQTAWIAWTRMYYQGRTNADGSMVVEYKPSLPMRDPSTKGDIWYDATMVNSPASCGDSAGAFHGDGPWHEMDKTRINDAVTGNPVNYLTGYTRGLHLVVYLTGKKKGGDFFKTPLKYRYWNSIQDFAFKPNYAKPESTWESSGGIKINVGGQGSGETSDATYFTTSGTTLNSHFNDDANWTVTKRK